MREKSDENTLRYENHPKKPPIVIKIVVCLTDRLTMMLLEGRQSPKKDRRKAGKN